MNPAEMSDDELAADRTVSSCTGAEGVGYIVRLSCGHEALFITEPAEGWACPCAQCIYLLVERRRKR